ncbi:hypothetical protein [Streptococcus saliviloxodontae]|uniref:ABC-2 type transport system permease protein n=1 Tax=Streptococcus saliviloxodontae TaxID=1349416 RepID=A0ABS2PJK2_9STRE|nr:hypothetical protein [Streptococcus saliviloxodontae]MBM7635462.1 ABC-2 type transport system permease protein [Streptococcus saliviloxodontae]
MNLLSLVFKSVFKRRDVYILLAFSLLPLLVGPLSDVQEGKQAGSFTSSAVAYFNSGIETQFQLVLPSLILGFIVSSVFHDEIRSGIMFLYKDIKRSTIFNAKLLSLFAVYGIYLGLSCIVSILAYYLVILPKFGGDAHFLAVAGTGQAVFLQLLSNIAIHLILITLIAAISIKKSTLPAVLHDKRMRYSISFSERQNLF